MITKIGRRHLIGLFFIICHLIVSPARAQSYEVLPMPQSVQLQQGEPFVLNGEVQILAGEGLQQEAEFLQAYLKDLTDLTLPIARKRVKKVSYIELAVSPKVTEKEGYVLNIYKKGVTIVGGSAAGVFYGIQTLRKSLTPDSRLLTPVSISDAPRFSWQNSPKSSLRKNYNFALIFFGFLPSAFAISTSRFLASSSSIWHSGQTPWNTILWFSIRKPVICAILSSRSWK